MEGTISIDMDTLPALYKRSGAIFPASYDSSREFEEGTANLCKLFDDFGLKTTLFCIGRDLIARENQRTLQEARRKGHEVASHSMNHIQGFRFLPKNQKEKEISDFERICESILGEKPCGFRAPGWNINEESLEILVRRGYGYDSSIFPTSLMPFMKIYYYSKTKACPRKDRTTMGKLRYIFYPLEPYRTRRQSFRKGKDGIMEFPLSVSPVFRIPLSGTFLIEAGWENFKRTFVSIQRRQLPVQFMLHLSDFVDFSRDYYSRMMAGWKGVYIPKGLVMSFHRKCDLIKMAIERMASSYHFLTYQERCPG